MRRPINPPTKEPAIPSAEVASSPMWSAPGRRARASRPMTNPVRTDHMTCDIVAWPSYAGPRVARIDLGDNPPGARYFPDLFGCDQRLVGVRGIEPARPGKRGFAMLPGPM